MSLRRVLLLFVLAAFFQVSLINLVAVHGATPHLLLCLITAIVFYHHDGYRCLPVALVCALFVDAAGGQYLGVGALALLVMSGVVYFFRINLNTENPFPMMVTALVAVLVYDVVYWGVMLLLGVPMAPDRLLWHSLVSGIYDLLLIGVLFFVMRSREPAPERTEEVTLEGYGPLEPDVSRVKEER